MSALLDQKNEEKFLKHFRKTIFARDEHFLINLIYQIERIPRKQIGYVVNEDIFHKTLNVRVVKMILLEQSADNV